MNQREIISGFIDENKIKMNPELFVRSDDEVIEQLKNAILSCQRTNKYFAIKVKAFHIVEEYEKIMKTLYEYYNNAY